jgi:hypothetical protein
VLEVASGTGEHACFFASRFPQITWQPTDPDPAARASIDAWRAEQGVGNVRPALELDATWPRWPVDEADAIVNINMIHIAPFEACEGLFEGAARLLPASAPVVLYGPFRFGGEHTAPSNERFDASLKARDPRFGVRDRAEVQHVAQTWGFRLEEEVAMPANNYTLVFRRQDPALALG